jgi:chaperone modulatory protein CbpM
MINENELVGSIQPLDAESLRRWIALGWVLPRQENASLRFDRSDVARVRLICELHYELRIEEDSLSVVLSLMDQLYATRRALGALKAAVEAQPDDVRDRIAEHLNDHS